MSDSNGQNQNEQAVVMETHLHLMNDAANMVGNWMHITNVTNNFIMVNLYQKLLWWFEIISRKEYWELYKLWSSKIFNWYILIIFITLALYIYIPYYSEYILSILWFLISILLLKFWEYKGYNEALHDLETNNIDTYE